MTFDQLVGLLLSQRAEMDLQLFNPFATERQVQSALELTSLALFTANRIGQAQRCLVEVRELVELIQQLKPAASRRSSLSGDALERAALSKAEMLASSLTARRHYATASTITRGGALDGVDTEVATFDPRLLAFEFTHDLLLRDAQVVLLHRFLEAHARNRSLCHQLIMGQGKTTVIAPLLALMIADGAQLVISIVPPHLLPSARAVLREKLAASLQRPVYGMSFDRYTAVSRGLLEQMMHATALRGVLLTEPSCVKSVMLKFVDCLVELQGEVQTHAPPQEQGEIEIIWRLQRLLGLRRRRNNRPVYRSRRQELKLDAEVLAQVLGLFRRSVALLDEVDVLLHPLRSELNWPQGERHPIHFAPMRWQLPFHLLDGALYPSCGVCTATWHESPEAQSILTQICEATKEGMNPERDCALQATPHVHLLDRSFYEERLRPLLTHWALLWLRRNRVQQGSDDHIIAYLSRGAPRASGAANGGGSVAGAGAAAAGGGAAGAAGAVGGDDPLSAHARTSAAAREAEAAQAAAEASSREDGRRWQWLVQRLPPEQMQLLNLAHTWLQTVLPHILCKVARVHYGLLPERMLAEAAQRHLDADASSRASGRGEQRVSSAAYGVGADGGAAGAPPARPGAGAGAAGSMPGTPGARTSKGDGPGLPERSRSGSVDTPAGAGGGGGSLGGGGGSGGHAEGGGSVAGAGGVPQSRRLLAVPFVGKDVPSHAAEFSHPDALIGLTILAYRHQGLRRADFVGLINLLLEQMEQESGAYRHRPTAEPPAARATAPPAASTPRGCASPAAPSAAWSAPPTTGTAPAASPRPDRHPWRAACAVRAASARRACGAAAAGPEANAAGRARVRRLTTRRRRICGRCSCSTRATRSRWACSTACWEGCRTWCSTTSRTWPSR